jgi:CMP-N,N'-diacetyllegionaminic acid synthase
MNKKINILAVIPARGGSKGIPNKNIKLLNGKPLIYYSLRLAKEAERKKVIVGHIVSTDSKKIASIVKEEGGYVPFMRPKELATDDSPVIHTIIHAVRWWEKQYNRKIHSVLLMQPTNPLTTLSDIEGSIKHYVRNQPKARCLISVCDAQHVRLPTLYYKRGKYLEQAVPKINQEARRQDLNKIYWRNGSIYISRRDLLLQNEKVIDSSPLYYEMPKFRSVAIDDSFDWTLAEMLMNYNRKRSTK